jgi:hypothetical protein
VKRRPERVFPLGNLTVPHEQRHLGVVGGPSREITRASGVHVDGHHISIEMRRD